MTERLSAEQEADIYVRAMTGKSVGEAEVRLLQNEIDALRRQVNAALRKASESFHEASEILTAAHNRERRHYERAEKAERERDEAQVILYLMQFHLPKIVVDETLNGTGYTPEQYVKHITAGLALVAEKTEASR